MHFTTRIDGSTACIAVHGEIDYDTLPLLRAAAAALPPGVTELVWDLEHARFMDVAGLHLLFE
ncbi:STAS domain-containing protein [Streptomyces cellulosae]